MQTDQLTYKDLSKKIEGIAREYFASKKEINSQGGFLDPSRIDEDSPSAKYMGKVNDAYCSLNDIEKAIIYNDFFYQGYPMWWKGRYNRSTYYRYKNKAMIHFMEAFENDKY